MKTLKEIKEEVTHKDFGPMMDAFVSFASDNLGIKSLPKINYKNNEDQDVQPSFGGYNPSSNEIVICTKNRHPMDVFRTLAHELVHHKQNEDGRIKDVSKEGATGSPIEDEANSMAGRLMRMFGKSNPDKFVLSHIVESKYTNNNKGTEMSDLDEACWKGYYQPKKQKLKPKKGAPGQFVPNCVPKKSIDEEFENLTEAKKTKKKAKGVNPDKSVFGKALMAAQKMRYAEKQASEGKRGIERRDYAAHYAMQDPVALVKAHIAKHSHKPETKPAAVTPTTHAAPPEPPKPVRPAQVHAPKPMPTHTGTHRKFDDFVHYISHIGETGDKLDYKLAKKLIKKDKTTLLAAAMRESHPVHREIALERIKEYEKQSLDTLREIKGGMFHKILKAVRLREENTPSDREWGKPSLTKIYAEATPGQSFPFNPLFEKRKFVRKKKLEEDGLLGSTLDAFMTPNTLPSSDTIGSEYGNRYPGITGVGTGDQSSIGNTGYPYGTLAEDHKPMHFKQLREAFDKGIGLLGTVEKSGSNEIVDEERPGLWANIHARRASGERMRRKGEKGAPTEAQLRSAKGLDENVDKASMKCNKPRAQAHGSGETGKSHIVKACAGGKEKIIRFGQLGVKGSPKKEGESQAYANRRKRFKARHSKNIAKGKMSAAYWANRVKW